MQIKTKIAVTELRSLSKAELECVTGGTLNCAPVWGEDGQMYSPTLDGYPGGPLRTLGGVWRIPQFPRF
jgi:hypothetical protein